MWKGDLFAFGGIPRNEDVLKKNPKSGFYLLKPSEIVNFETQFEVELI